MDLAELQGRINRHVQLDLGPIYQAYRAQTGSESIEGFLEFLRTSRIIDTSLFTELHAGGGVEIPRVGDPALAGTQLADWAAATMAAPEPGPGAARAMGTYGNGATAGAQPAPRTSDRPPELRYHPVALLGQGAMGAVAIARDLYLRRKVALKTVLPEMAAHPQLLSRFLSEMQITAQLEHPNIVPIYGLEIAPDGTLGYAMKLVHGKDLAHLLEETRELVEKGKPLDEEHTLEKRLEYFLKVCDAVDVAHAKGIVHRDLKPANVMLGRHNEVYLMDWGIARPMGAGGQALEAGLDLYEGQQIPEGGGDAARTRLGTAIGTPSYMSPEQAAGRNGDLDGRSDQYSLGLILQECVTLTRAVQGTTLQEILTKAKEARRDAVASTKIGSMPKELDAIIRRSTRLRPEDRYATVRALADDVRRYLRGDAVSALPDSLLRAAARWVSKHRTASLAIMLGLLLLGATATIVVLVVQQSRIAALHARELRTSEMQTESAIAAQLVDRELQRYEAALAQFVGVAQSVLSKPGAGGSGAHFDEHYATKTHAPSDLGPSKRYGKEVSVLASVVSLAPGTNRDAVDPLLRAVPALGPALCELMIDTGGGHSHKMSRGQQRDAIADLGVPAFRAGLILKDGVELSYPGMAGHPGRDARSDPSYELAEGKTGLHWGKPASGGGQVLLPVSSAVFDESGGFLGVAVLEVTLDRMLERPGAAALDYVQTSMLVGRDGKVMAHKDRAGSAPTLAPEVVEAIAAGRSGKIETIRDGHRTLSTFYPLTSMDWYYVAVADVGRMVASAAAIRNTDPRRVIMEAAPPPPPPDPRPAPPPPEPQKDLDAGADAAPDAAPPDAGPVYAPWPPRGYQPPPASTPAASAPAPRNPFDKWQEYDKGKKTP